MIRKKRIKRFLTLLASFILVVHVNAQYVYQPFVKEGKIWILKDFDYNDYQYQMEGDTVIAGEVMKKVYLIDHAFYHDNDLHYLGAVKEVDRKVYITYADEDTSMLLYDFSIEPSSLTHSPSVITYDKWYAAEIDRVDYCLANSTLRHLQKGNRYYTPDVLEAIPGSVSFLEGVGSVKDMDPFQYQLWGHCWLWACIEDGNYIYYNDYGLYTVAPTYRSLLNHQRCWKSYNPSDKPGTEKKAMVLGDTIIVSAKFPDSGWLYRKLYCADKDMYGDTELHYYGAIREEGTQVYLIPDGSGEDNRQLLFDFGLKTGEQVVVSDCSVKVVETGSVFSEGVKYQRLTLHKMENGMDTGLSCHWIEGIGSDSGLLQPLSWDSADDLQLVVCDQETCIYNQTSVSAIADEDYANKEVTAPMELSTVGTGVPVIATKACSHAEMLYKHEYMNLMQGDFITQLTYNGYNPGEPFSRHITVWMSNTEQRNFNNQADMAPTSTMTKVFDGDCTIAAGGSVDERIPLLTIPLDQPFEYGGYTVRVVIESTGEPVSQDVCFEQYKERWVCRYTTAEENGGQWSEPEYSQFPLTTLMVATPVVNLTGTVCNQDKIPIPNATIQLKSTSYPSTTIYTGETDGDGNYAIRIEEGNKYYMATVSAPGCATYTETWRGTAVKEKSQWDFTLYDAVAYKAGQRATIIMPVAPDASAGRYYRLDRTEGSQLVFEREPSPQANVPYVIFPDRDFSVDLKPLDLSGEAGKTSVPGVGFVGSYINYDFPTTTNQELIFLDETNDGGYEFKSDESYGGNYVVGGRIAALRACIIENGWYGKDIVFHDDNSVQPGDEGTVGMSVLSSSKAGGTVTYDLQGRRVQGKPDKGVYIHGGRKVVVK